MTFRHRAGVRPHVSPRGFAESCVFGKQSPGPILCGSGSRRSAPSPEVTGPFCRVPWPWFARPPRHALPAHLRRSAVRARGRCPAAFLGALGARVRSIASRLAPPCGGGLAIPPAGLRRPARPEAGPPPQARPRVGRDAAARCRNVHLLSIGYASRPPLRPRLSLGGSAFPRRPRAFGAGDSLPGLATRASILTPARSTGARRAGFPARGKLPYRPWFNHGPAASAPRLAP